MRMLMSIVPMVALLCACKPKSPENTATVQSVDNFAGDTFTWNECQASKDAPAVILPAGRISAGEFSDEIAATMQVVPPGLRSAFFGAPINGRIELTTDIAAACPSAISDSATATEVNDQTLSCIKSVGLSGPVTIFIKKGHDPTTTRKHIRHTVLRAFAYVLAEIIADNLPQSDVIRRVGDELAVRLLTDMADRRVSLSRFSHMLPGNLLIAGMDKDARRRAYLATPQSQRQKFSEAVLAEVADSVLCSGTSLAALKKDYPEVMGPPDHGEGTMAADIAAYVLTMNAKDAIDQIMAGLADADKGLEPEVQAADAGSAQESGLSLWGRWGWGNGPLRQGVRNWGAWRSEGNGLFNARRWNSGGGYVFRRPWFAPWRWGQG